MRYEGQVFRPFSEAHSYLLQCTIGCSHNRCTFCGMYKDRRYRVRSMDEIMTDIQMAKAHYGDLEKVFLCDGDAIAMETPALLEILSTLYKTFPSLRHVGSYVGPQSTLAKGADLSLLRSAGLTKAYLGVESGDDVVLAAIKKGVNAKEMLEAGQRLVAADINLSSMVLLGIAAGNGEAARQHAEATAEITNLMKPRYLAALTYTPVPGTVLFKAYEKGERVLPDPFETLEEMKIIFENITIDHLKFVGAHASNYLPVSGELQKDRAKMIETVDGILETRNVGALRSEGARGL
ncbi:radical SAM protein [Desulfoluna sp.]|uniref:radical SAM protein n=1 Tax=Desulfoluna sp. TaxID=2045199 RepID=UPI0026170EA3|nr:radical SAM protein [Desulfoluna sp.]